MAKKKKIVVTKEELEGIKALEYCESVSVYFDMLDRYDSKHGNPHPKIENITESLKDIMKEVTNNDSIVKEEDNEDNVILVERVISQEEIENIKSKLKGKRK